MQVVRILALLKMLFVVAMAMSTGAHAESLLSYAHSEYYLGHGGNPPTLAELAAHPRQYFRSEAAYESFISGVVLEGYTLEEMKDAGLVRTVACNGERIETSGLTTSGEIRWFTRDCYRHEELIQVRQANGAWQTAGSLGCLNRVKAVIVIPRVEMTFGVMNVPGRRHYTRDINSCGCVFPGQDFWQPGSDFQPSNNWNWSTTR